MFIIFIYYYFFLLFSSTLSFDFFWVAIDRRKPRVKVFFWLFCFFLFLKWVACNRAAIPRELWTQSSGLASGSESTRVREIARIFGARCGRKRGYVLPELSTARVRASGRPPQRAWAIWVSDGIGSWSFRLSVKSELRVGPKTPVLGEVPLVLVLWVCSLCYGVSELVPP